MGWIILPGMPENKRSRIHLWGDSSHFREQGMKKGVQRADNYKEKVITIIKNKTIYFLECK